MSCSVDTDNTATFRIKNHMISVFVLFKKYNL